MDKFKISDRLKKVATLINKGGITADIGTDHGYLPVYIIMNNISSKVIAMDVRKKPLEKAGQNIRQFMVEDNIELRLSDGLEKLHRGEADTITICGMGGKLMQRIITNGYDVIKEDTQLILSPQSEIDSFREFLENSDIRIIDEHMIKEDGQFYFIMECKKDGGLVHSSYDTQKHNGKNNENHGNNINSAQDYRKQAFLRYGTILLKKKDANLKQYILKDMYSTEKVYEKIKNLDNKSDGVKNRMKEVESELKCIKYALSFYGDSESITAI